MKCKAVCPMCGIEYEIDLPMKKFNDLKDNFNEVVCLCNDCLRQLKKDEEERQFEGE